MVAVLLGDGRGQRDGQLRGHHRLASVDVQFGDYPGGGVPADLAGPVLGDADAGDTGLAGRERGHDVDDVGGTVETGKLVLGADGVALGPVFVLRHVVDHQDGGGHVRVPG